MNHEELNQLKKGDEIFIRATFNKILDDGDVSFLHTQTSLDDEVEKTEEYTLPGNVILPLSAPKYDPCRPFKEGDIVCHVERAGRTYFDAPPLGEKCRVIEPENKAGIVCVEYKVNDERYTHEIPFYHLELVTPVEEMEPYYVGTWENMLAVYKKTHEDIIISMFSPSHPHAKEAAEAERDRLNAEHRKGKA